MSKNLSVPKDDAKVCQRFGLCKKKSIYFCFWGHFLWFSVGKGVILG